MSREIAETIKRATDELDGEELDKREITILFPKNEEGVKPVLICTAGELRALATRYLDNLI